MPDRMRCSIDGCDRPHKGHGWCNPHYQRWLKHGDSFDRTPVAPRTPAAERTVEWFWAGFKRNSDGCMEWQRGRMPNGYGVCNSDFGAATRLTHRIAWTLANGPIPDGLHVLHRCDNPPCGNVDHLFLGTHLDNIEDMVSKGRGPKGRDHGSAKLAEPQVLSVLLRLEGGEAQAAIAARFGVSHGTVNDIAHGRTWKHISPH